VHGEERATAGLFDVIPVGGYGEEIDHEGTGLRDQGTDYRFADP
jgi:hypothetical protein